MIPFQIVMIPLYILTVQLGIRNTYIGSDFSGNCFCLQAFQGVPKEMEEAAEWMAARTGLVVACNAPGYSTSTRNFAMFVFMVPGVISSGLS